jgi:rSAM/selenodomain-associated transferase 1
MAKYPAVGMVKTRLGESIGAEKGAHLYLCFLRDTIEKVNSLSVPFFIYYTPEDKITDFKRLFGNDLGYLPQRGDDLGERLYNGFVKSFENGFTSAIALASDVPDLPKAILDEALKKLTENDSVIGPSFDGGYYLIGLRKDSASKNLFRGIAWSTETVFKETMKKIKQGNISCHALAPWGDVDQIADLNRLLSSEDPVFHRSYTWRFLNSSELLQVSPS